MCWSLKRFFLSQNNPAEWKGVARSMYRANKYLTVRDGLLAGVLLRNLTCAPGSTQDTVVSDVENVLTNETKNARILRQLNNLRTTLRKKMRLSWRAYEQVPIQEGNDVGHIPPLETLTQLNLKTSALLSWPTFWPISLKRRRFRSSITRALLRPRSPCCG